MTAKTIAQPFRARSGEFLERVLLSFRLRAAAGVLLLLDW